jgi:hypothetical protein
MTISSTTVKNSYSGNGTLDTFNYTFKVFANTDLQVIIRDASAIETVKTLTTHYTVTGAGNVSGGTVVFTTGNIPTATETVVIRRASPQTQAIDYIANDPFPAESHEEGLDRSMMAIQQLQEEIDRSIKLSRTNTMTSTEFTVGDTDRANKVFGFDASGELTVAQELGTFKGNWSSGTTFAVRDIIKDTSNNNVYICLTAHTSSGSQPISTNADVAKWGLLVDAAAATTSATNAANSASAAATSETNAATSETNAATSETNSANSATASATSATSSASSASSASSSATAAASSASAAEATFDLFDDAFLGAKSSNPSVDNDGNALQDGALYFDTTNDVMKVYNLASTTWLQLTPTVTNQNNINSAVANASNINAAVANESNINAAVSNASNINSVVSNASNINSVAGISTAITNVNNNSSNINAVNSNSANINLTAGSIANVNNVGGSIASVNTAASNLTSINSFANTYLGASSSAPTQDPDGSSLDLGDLYFDTGSNQLKVYSSTGWVNAGSSVNGTSERFKYTISGTPTTVSGNDDNSNSLTYDAGFIDVFLNGIKMVNGTDVTVTSGNSVVFASALTNGDVVDIVTFGTFNIATLGNTIVTGGLSFADNVKAKFGTGNDLEIFHDGSNSNISDVGTGQLVLRTDGAQVIINKGSSENMARFITDGAVELYHNNIKKFETTSGGATVTGDFTATGNISAGNNGSIFLLDNIGQKVGQLTNDSSSSHSLQIDADPDNSGANTYMQFKIDDSEKARLDASGDLFIGKTSISTNAVGVALTGSGLGAFTRSGDPPLIANRTSSDGTIALFRKDNSTVGAITARSGDMSIHSTASNHSGLRFGFNSIFGTSSSGAENDNTVDFGSPNLRFKDIYLGGEGKFSKARSNTLGQSAIKILPSDTVVGYGFRMEQTNNDLVVEKSAPSGSELEIARFKVGGGIALGGTGTANTLDDYEEGSWTPANPNISLTEAYGRYTKIGNLVTIRASVVIPTTSDSNQFTLSGLPFTVSNTDANVQGNISLTSIGTDNAYLVVVKNNTTMRLVTNTNSAIANSACSGDFINFSVAYTV